jgi:hypothetical protein
MNYKNVLTPAQREKLVQWLSSEATDEILLRAAQETKDHKLFIAREFSSLDKYLGLVATSNIVAPPTLPTKPVSSDAKSSPTQPESASSSIPPPGTATSRIGTETKTAIKRHLDKGPDTDEAIAVVIKRTPAQTRDLLKLLWERKEVLFDGKKYRSAS